jgi:hypoxanthine phosphoribosyltransferase
MSRLDEAQAVLKQADVVCDEATINTAYDNLARQIEADYADKNPLILAVMIGGLQPAAELLKRTRFAFELDYLHATRYRGATSGGGLVWKRKPDAALEGRHVLVIDDILDEGHTLVAIREALLAMKPASLRVAVLATKSHDRRAPAAHAEYIGVTLPDRYVFGCGMDYKEYWRQLPAIYAVKS